MKFGSWLWTLVFALSGCSTHRQTVGPTTGESPLTLEILAAPVSRISVHGRNGGLTIRPGTADRIRVRVTLADGCAPGHRIESSLEDGLLQVDLDPSTTDRCRETWVVEAPSRIALKADLGDATVDVAGMAGGVDVTVGAGTIRLDLPAGDVSATVAKGDIDARTDSDGYGELRASAEVGRVSLIMNGLEVRHARPPGPGDQLELAGTSRYAITLHATVGDIRVEIGHGR